MITSFPKYALLFFFLATVSSCVGQAGLVDSQASVITLTSAQETAVAGAINRIKKHSETKNFHTVIDYPFVITGNLSNEELLHWRSRIQRTRKALKKKYFKSDPKKLIQVWLFKDIESYYDFNHKLWGISSPISPYGFYLPSKNIMVMNIATGGGTLTHELVHPYMETNFSASPLWFNEGLGSLYEKSSYPGGRIKGLVNWRLQVLKASIRAKTAPGLKEMMATSPEEFYGVNKEVHYAQARYLMYYLQTRGLLAKYYSEFSKNAIVDPSGMNTLIMLIEEDTIDEFEERWLTFVESL